MMAKNSMGGEVAKVGSRWLERSARMRDQGQRQGVAAGGR